MQVYLNSIPTFTRFHCATIASTLTLLCLGVVGCGGDNLGRVSGVVTLDGEPLKGATVEFQPETGSPSYGETDNEGQYVLMFAPEKPGAVIGKHTVRISTQKIVMENDTKMELPERVPSKYNDDSTETREVKSGKQVIDFDLERN